MVFVGFDRLGDRNGAAVGDTVTREDAGSRGGDAVQVASVISNISRDTERVRVTVRIGVIGTCRPAWMKQTTCRFMSLIASDG